MALQVFRMNVYFGNLPNFSQKCKTNTVKDTLEHKKSFKTVKSIHERYIQQSHVSKSGMFSKQV